MVIAFCARCHGRDGTGSFGPDLSRARFRKGDADHQIFTTISNGIPGTSMPGFAGAPERMIWQLVAFIQSRRRLADKPPELKGNEENGALLFAQHKCASCHWERNAGGRRGPDLSRATSPPDHVREAILDPSVFVDQDYRWLAIETEDGKVYAGMWLNEDGYHFQLINQEEQLLTVPKTGSTVRRQQKSLMPSFRKELTPEQLEDLVAYVFSLRTREVPKP